MKLSVSVPDELWDAAVRSSADRSPSAIVKTALGEMLAPRDATTTSLREVAGDRETADLFVVAREKVLANARDIYLRAYRVGLRLAGAIPYSRLEALAANGADEVWTTDWFVELDSALQRDVEEVIGELGYVSTFSQVPVAPNATRLAIEGIDAAIRDLWKSVIRVEIGPDRTGQAATSTAEGEMPVTVGPRGDAANDK